MPRSEKGYSAAIGRIETLRNAVRSDKSTSQYLQGIKQEATKWENGVNLDGTILTFAVGLGLKGIQLVTAANRLKAAQVTGVALEEMVVEKSIKNAEFIFELVGGTTTTAAEISNASNSTKNSLKVTKGVSSGVLDAKIMHGLKGKSLKAAIAHGIATTLVGTMDVFKYVNPGSLARLLSGLDDELEQQERSSTTMQKQLLDNLSAKLLELQKEAELVYKN